MGYILELNVDRRLLLDILSDGIEFVCRGYWGQIERYRWYWWYVCDETGEPVVPEKINPDLTGDTVLCRIRDDEDGEAEEENRPFVDITLNKMEKAFFSTMLTHPHLVSILETNNGVVTDADYDALTSDVILQKIVFGKVVYG